MFHGTFCFMNFEGYGWYLSSTAMLLYASLYLHNIIAWMKTKAFLSPRNSRIYIFSFLLTTPYWILETYDNFTFFNNINRLFLRTRPFEALFRLVCHLCSTLLSSVPLLDPRDLRKQYCSAAGGWSLLTTDIETLGGSSLLSTFCTILSRSTVSNLYRSFAQARVLA